ncbi:MAG: SulP family inorganic anion transporter [Hyphomicrobiaceae bacterium]
MAVYDARNARQRAQSIGISIETAFVPTILRSVAWALALVIVGTLAVVLALSFAALIFAGPLAPHLGQGSSLMLIGGCVLGLVGVTASSIRGGVLGMQDAPAIILALAAASIAADWSDAPEKNLFSTIAMLLAVSSLALGAVLYLLGKFHLGTLVRYLPYPVIGGFMAATGWFLLIGAFATMTRKADQNAVFDFLLGGQGWMQWGPGIAIGLALFFAARVLKSWAALPVVIGGSFACFYAVLAIGGTSLDWAADKGLLLGPFPDTDWSEALPNNTAKFADWFAIADHIPFILAAVVMAVVGMLLNLTGAELATGEPADVDRDLRQSGLANFLAGGAGGGSGYIFISLTLLARQLGGLGRSASAAAGVACGLTLVYGTSLISILPLCVFGGLTAYLGIDLLFQWLWLERRRLPPLDYGIIVTILVVAATIGFLEGVAAGLLASVVVFVHSCVSAPVVRRSFTNKIRTSSIERPAQWSAIVEKHGDETIIYQLEGVLFFGTITKLANKIASDIECAERKIERIIIDFEYVQSVDTSAVYGMVKAAADCRRRGVDLAISGLKRVSQSRRSQMLGPLLGGKCSVFTSLDNALEWAEERTIENHSEPVLEPMQIGQSIFDDGTGDADLAVAKYFESEQVPAGQILVRRGEIGSDILFLRGGTLIVELTDELSENIRVGVHFPGTIIGEMAFYTGGERSANVVAHTDCEVLRLTKFALEKMEADEPQLAIRFHRRVARQISTRLIRTNSLVTMLKA